MSRIPPEIIEQILLLSPAKSLGRFKLVSKDWNSIISDPQFIKTHTHQLLLQPTKKLLVVSTTKRRHLYSIELTIDNIINDIPATPKKITLGSPPIRWNNIVGSCNGLVLARDVNGDMFLVNPTTYVLWKLPVNPFLNYTDVYCDNYGFGYDLSSDDYKVVFICVPYGIGYKNSFCIYSLRNNFWRKLPRTRNDIRVSCALVNGNFHWLTKWSMSIIAFSFVDELFFEIKPPDPVLNSDSSWIGTVVEISRKLGVYFSDFSPEYLGDELWVMQEYGDAKSWTRMCSHKYWKTPVCLVEGSDRDIVLKGMCNDAVVVFNMDERRDRKVRIPGVPNRNINNIEGTFVESIESIKRINTLAFQLR